MPRRGKRYASARGNVPAGVKFDPPEGFSHADVLTRAHHRRAAAGAANITDIHLADAIHDLVHQDRPSLTADR